MTHFQATDLSGSTAHANRSALFMNAVRRIDNPFAYGGILERRGAAGIEMFPLTGFLARAHARLGTLGAPR
ncbi:MAG: hypothetical protein JNN18_22530 [Rubrivivax sp.]|nr:hypothetical protein [Rubrivivax sp.]